MLHPLSELVIDGHSIGENYPSYFIADIAANHDGDLSRAIDLIYMAKEAGASAAKFQHFKAETIVSDTGFKSLGQQKSHQSKWSKSVFEVYKEASINLGWTDILKETCDKAGITFFTSPYDLELLNLVDPYVPAYKIGSGEITWLEMVESIAKKNKPYMLATGASTMDEVYDAVKAGLNYNPQIVLMQCNTNYTGSIENMRYVKLNVLKSYRAMFPSMILGLSDHTPGHATVLGAITLGAKVIEKHFTDNQARSGPDHAFSMNPVEWGIMVSRTRELEAALGDGIKKIEDNELQTVVLQRRALCVTRDLNVGDVITKNDLIALRPCPENAIPPYLEKKIIGKALRVPKESGDYILISDLL